MMQSKEPLSDLLSQKAFGKMYKRNAMHSLSWLTGFLELVFVYGFIQADALWIQIASLVLMILTLGFYCYVYLYLLKNDPDRLQSEGCNIASEVVRALNDNRVEPEPIQAQIRQIKSEPEVVSEPANILDWNEDE